MISYVIAFDSHVPFRLDTCYMFNQMLGITLPNDIQAEINPT
jgi:hypothetical protein